MYLPYKGQKLNQNLKNNLKFKVLNFKLNVNNSLPVIRGVQPSSLVASTFAFLASSSLTTSAWPFSEAISLKH